MHTTVVIGATGILRPATETLLTAGTNVIAVGRDPARFAGLREVANLALGAMIELAHDARSESFVDTLSLLARREGLVVDDVVAYAPATSLEVLSAITHDGRLRAVEVVTSNAAAPRQQSVVTPWTLEDLPERPWKRLVLGWQYRDDGIPRWHDPAEISTAVLETREAMADKLLGVVTPWTDRPR